MKTEEYISSGLLEAYLLGLVSDEDKREVERTVAAYPEIGLYLDKLEVKLESQFLQGAVPPPPALRELVELKATQQEIKHYEETDQQQHRPSSNPTADRSGYVDVEVSNTHIQVHKYWRAAFIAVFILSKVFLVFGLYYYFKAQSQEQEIERLTKQVQQTVLQTNTP
ncbi:hypothetical protein BN8_01489 [Fibrisoma limi BUZ 3]|uniref:Uncharacterized protein n=1 Tax=Fibrisoma limi BUZ 3 TaxID=1185876 RepID=I2GF09_9BACT|nr:hypothetical protein [Fibrisoma limi]CCH52484.1 hypothetical protein BN8_01489 [Fibrisoma limi BUZ 3]